MSAFRWAMGREDWYRNTSWNSEIETAFAAKLRRAKDKSQYLRIQACTLARRHPDVALRLIDEYFALGDHFDHAQAYLDQANAYLATGNVAAAITSFESALAREKAYPYLFTYAYLEFPCLIAIQCLADRYAQVLEVLDANESRLAFPRDRYLWSGSRALILHALGKVPEARTCAQAALAAASETQSGFRYHQQVGLVQTTDDEFGDRLNAIARPPN